jgi:tRNA A37 threonylcarbamoyladenosine synthetase subunit TsaC/SUA5/YrdC
MITFSHASREENVEKISCFAKQSKNEKQLEVFARQKQNLSKYLQNSHRVDQVSMSRVEVNDEPVSLPEWKPKKLSDITSA